MPPAPLVVSVTPAPLEGAYQLWPNIMSVQNLSLRQPQLSRWCLQRLLQWYSVCTADLRNLKHMPAIFFHLVSLHTQHIGHMSAMCHQGPYGILEMPLSWLEYA